MMKLSSFLQGKVHVFFYQSLGWRFCFYYLILLGKLYFLINRDEKQAIIHAVELVFQGDKDHSELKTTIHKVFLGILSHYYEKIFQAHECIEKLKDFYFKQIEAKYLHKINNELEKGKGVLFITGHYGAIEYIPFFLAMKQYPISAVGKFTTKQLEDLIVMKGRAVGLRIINGNQKNQVIHSIIKELKDNRIVFIECDEIEEWRQNSKERIFFLKKKIGVDKLLSVIQKRTGAGVIFGLLHRLNIQKYELILKDYQDLFLRFGMMTSSVGGLVLKALEEHIYAFPEEWYQWKNYSLIHTVSPAPFIIEEANSTALGQPIYGDVH
jgi:lauroyl/myristoyl acyltransferase